MSAKHAKKSAHPALFVTLAAGVPILAAALVLVLAFPTTFSALSSTTSSSQENTLSLAKATDMVFDEAAQQSSLDDSAGQASVLESSTGPNEDTASEEAAADSSDSGEAQALTDADRTEEDWGEYSGYIIQPRLIEGAAAGSGTPEIICWGDSLTYGTGADEAYIYNDTEQDGFYDASEQGYPEILSHLTGLTTLNFGVPGASSDEIVDMQHGIFPTWMNEYLGPETGGFATLSANHVGGILILEIGSNGGWEDFSELIQQYQTMLTYAGATRYIIVGDTDNPGESADENQGPFSDGETPGQTDWEAALEEAFGDHFLNMRAFLVEEGLQTAGLYATDYDWYCMDNGMVPDSLRADWTHLNSYGYYAQATAIYQKGAELGYWS